MRPANALLLAVAPLVLSACLAPETHEIGRPAPYRSATVYRDVSYWTPAPVVETRSYPARTYAAPSYDAYGFDRDGYDRQGYDRAGFDRHGRHRDGYARSGVVIRTVPAPTYEVRRYEPAPSWYVTEPSPQPRGGSVQDIIRSYDRAR